ncbi:MAG: threonine--tRNA ligase, partial [Cytophagales bacterium]|nr:threonine--tRNA ligase [Cytophagales bacterium]
YIKAIKILNVAGAYWRGDEKNKQLIRLYGISFPGAKDLRSYLTRMEEAKSRDHRELAKKLGLFSFSERVGVGLPLWLPGGSFLRNELENFIKVLQQKAGYLPVITPHIGRKKLYEISGHDEKYGADSFQPILSPHDEIFMLRPMNCPHHCEIYRSVPRSYRDLPLRLSELGTVYRYEQSGELHGLTRVRGFTQDDAHIFCTRDQVKSEFSGVIDLVLRVFAALDFQDYRVQISVRSPDTPDKYMGSDSDWDRAEADIKESVLEKGLSAEVVSGEAAFYGPKLDFMVRDALDREWQLGTIQLDYQLPQRFGLEYVGSDNRKHVPIMIHRAPFGSMERFIALLIEHTGGKFPFWLAPTQLILLSVSDRVEEYVHDLRLRLRDGLFRVDTDLRNEKIGKKIRDAELMKIPYMLIIGDREMENREVSVRGHGKGKIGVMGLSELEEWLEDQRKHP